MNIKRLLLFFLLALFFLGNIFAQQNYLQVASLGLENGLSQNTVRCIAQDELGFVWIGTQNGLNRYNAYDFEVFQHEPNKETSLPSDEILCLRMSQKKELWIGTMGGLARYNVIKNQFLNFEKPPLGKTPVYSIAEDATGNLWIGTAGRLVKMNLANNSLEAFRLETDSMIVYDILIGLEQEIWLGTSKGLVKFDENNTKFDFIIPNVQIRTLAQDEKSIWAGSKKGLHIVNPNLTIQTLAMETEILAIYPLQNEVWIGTETGLFKFDKRNGRLRFFSKKTNVLNTLNDDHINCIFQDKIGTLWIGTNKGINKYSTLSKTFTHYKYVPMSGISLNDDIVTSFWQDRKGSLWVGTANGGLNKLDSISGEFLHFTKPIDNREGISNKSVWAISEDEAGYLWVGTSKGLNRLDTEKNEFKNYFNDPENPSSLPENFILSLLKDSQGNIWIGTHGGGLAFLAKKDLEKPVFTIFKYDPKRNHSLSSNIVRCIYEDRKGNIWIGTKGGGLNCVKKNMNPNELVFNVFKKENTPKNLKSNDIWSITEDKEGGLWIGTSEGLHFWDEKEKAFKVFSKAEGLPNNTIYGIVAHETDLWLSTNRGMSRMSRKDQKFRNFDVKDGLQGNEFNGGAYYQNRQGEIFFGGNNGFNSFHPKRILDNPHAPAVVITSCKVFNEELELDSQITIKRSITLPADRNFIAFEFSALNYILPEKNQYEYKLDGLDKDWVRSTRRFASYTNLAVGEYVFRLRAANNDGVWNETGVVLHLEIVEPLWKRTWFWLLILGIVVGAWWFWKRK